MKKITFFFLAVFISFYSNAQIIKNPTIDLFKDDSAIHQLLSNLPEGWKAKTDSTALYIYRTEDAWIPRESLKSFLACESCKQSIPLSRMINFNMDKRWCYKVPIYFKLYISTINSQKQAQEIKKHNAEKAKEIEKIKSKYKTSDLEKKYNLDALASYANGMSKNESKERVKYLNDLNKIGFTLPPNYLGDNYGLHIAYIQGSEVNDDKTDPPGIKDEINYIKELLNGYCEEVK